MYLSHWSDGFKFIVELWMIHIKFIMSLNFMIRVCNKVPKDSRRQIRTYGGVELEMYSNRIQILWILWKVLSLFSRFPYLIFVLLLIRRISWHQFPGRRLIILMRRSTLYKNYSKCIRDHLYCLKPLSLPSFQLSFPFYRIKIHHSTVYGYLVL